MDELLDNAPCGFVEFADDGTILVINLTLSALLEYPSGELQGRRVEAILSTAGRIFYQTHFFPLLRLHGRVEEVYLSLRSKQGAEVPVLINAVRREREGVAVNDCVLLPIRQRSLYEDEILRAKRAAEEATRAKDEFLAVVSHELRTPLNAILGWARMMRTGNLDREMVGRALDTIERNARSQAQLIEDLLDFSRIISGRLRLDVRSLQPAEVILSALDVVRPAADAKGIRLQTVLDPNAGPVSGDPDRLQQVIWNLLSNAIKFTPKGGRVQVRLQRINSHVEISISDNGQGISADFLPYVFDRFRQADNTSTRRHGGLGLGLSITRHIVELHGGTIRVFSDGPGQGATFTLELPLIPLHRPEQGTSHAAAPPAPEADSVVELPRLDGLRVLVVEDERDARELLTLVLTKSGACVTAAATVAEALEKLPLVKPDLLVSDIEMPGEDGYSLIRRVRSAEVEEGLRQIPAIALTAHARFTDRLRALSAGYHIHLPKPVEPAELVMLVANLSNRGLDR